MNDNLNTLSAAHWIQKDNRLFIQSASGLTDVSCSDVVRAEFRRQQTVENLKVKHKPSEDISNLKINRFPATLFIVLHLSEGINNKPVISLELSYNEISINIQELPATDQIITGSQWFPLLPDNLEDVKKTLAEIEIIKPGPISLKQSLRLMTSEFEYLTIVDEPGSEQDLESHDSLEITSSQLTRSGLNATLYPYQETGVNWLRKVTGECLGCILADEMGLGKTIQIIALIVLSTDNAESPSLIVAPATLLENWRREFKKFAPGVSVLVHAGSERTGFPKRLMEFNAVISSYDTVVRDQGMFGMINWRFVILDEAQAIKNPDTRRAKAIKNLKKDSGIAVTGTPVENRLMDLWSIMDFSNPELLGSRNTFETRYGDNLSSARELERIVTPLMLRRRVASVANDLPERIIIPQTVNMTENEVSAYEALRYSIKEEYGDKASLVSLLRLRQFCSHPVILAEEDITLGQRFSESSKYQRFIEILEEISAQKEKVVLFTSFTRMSDLIAKDVLSRLRIRTFQIDGRTEVSLRQEIVDRFSNAEGTALLVLNPRAAGTGLNITAANHVIHYNLEWNPAVEDQATARVYRRGQQYPVTVHRLFYPDTVEEIIDDRLARKRQLAETAVIGTEAEVMDATDIARALSITPAIRRSNGENHSN